MKRYIIADTKSLTIEQRKHLASITANTKLLYRLAFDRSMEVVSAVINNENTPTKVLKVIVDNYRDKFNSRDLHIESVANNPNCDINLINFILNNFISNEERYWYSNLAETILANTNNREIYEKLAASEFSRIRQKVAEAKNIPIDILEELAIDSDYQIRREIAERDDINSDILDILANDPESYVRQYVARNPNTSIDTLLQMLQTDDSGEIIRSATYNLRNNHSNLYNNQFSDILDTVISRLEDIERDFRGLYVLLSDIAANYRLSEADMLKISQIFEYNILRALARNKYVSPRILDKICDTGFELDRDDRYYLYEVIADNKKVTQDILNKIIPTIDNFETELALMIFRKTNNLEFINKHITGSWRIREAIASNPNVPVETLQRLARDSSKKVRDVANTTLITLGSNVSNVENKSQKKLASPVEWAISPYDLENYDDITDELNLAVSAVMDNVSKWLKTQLEYQFDSDSYDDAIELKVSTNSGKETVIDAQQFLSILTSLPKKNEGILRASRYVDSQLN